ncbi:hypothetical protein D9758_015370 [Tetrapyrgos nigripes]|uniref:Uncharacterized protein n=1 Tax=Tetrapyrgos nigripes TaxID=182062 RepID=A0A8H5CAH6_9AGAR|nr:hypothetical protein D9758_015370 [Tetrapyrgos nigripes]
MGSVESTPSESQREQRDYEDATDRTATVENGLSTDESSLASYTGFSPQHLKNDIANSDSALKDLAGKSSESDVFVDAEEDIDHDHDRQRTTVSDSDEDSDISSESSLTETNPGSSYSDCGFSLQYEFDSNDDEASQPQQHAASAPTNSCTPPSYTHPGPSDDDNAITASRQGQRREAATFESEYHSQSNSDFDSGSWVLEYADSSYPSPSPSQPSSPPHPSLSAPVLAGQGQGNDNDNVPDENIQHVQLQQQSHSQSQTQTPTSHDPDLSPYPSSPSSSSFSPPVSPSFSPSVVPVLVLENAANDLDVNAHGTGDARLVSSILIPDSNPAPVSVPIPVPTSPSRSPAAAVDVDADADIGGCSGIVSQPPILRVHPESEPDSEGSLGLEYMDTPSPSRSLFSPNAIEDLQPDNESGRPVADASESATRSAPQAQASAPSSFFHSPSPSASLGLLLSTASVTVVVEVEDVNPSNTSGVEDDGVDTQTQTQARAAGAIQHIQVVESVPAALVFSLDSNVNSNHAYIHIQSPNQDCYYTFTPAPTSSDLSRAAELEDVEARAQAGTGASSVPPDEMVQSDVSHLERERDQDQNVEVEREQERDRDREAELLMERVRELEGRLAEREGQLLEKEDELKKFREENSTLVEELCETWDRLSTTQTDLVNEQREYLDLQDNMELQLAESASVIDELCVQTDTLQTQLTREKEETARLGRDLQGRDAREQQSLRETEQMRIRLGRENAELREIHENTESRLQSQLETQANTIGIIFHELDDAKRELRQREEDLWLTIGVRNHFIRELLTEGESSKAKDRELERQGRQCRESTQRQEESGRLSEKLDQENAALRTQPENAQRDRDRYRSERDRYRAERDELREDRREDRGGTGTMQQPNYEYNPQERYPKTRPTPVPLPLPGAPQHANAMPGAFPCVRPAPVPTVAVPRSIPSQRNRPNSVVDIFASLRPL